MGRERRNGQGLTWSPSGSGAEDAAETLESPRERGIVEEGSDQQIREIGVESSTLEKFAVWRADVGQSDIYIGYGLRKVSMRPYLLPRKGPHSTRPDHASALARRLFLAGKAARAY